LGRLTRYGRHIRTDYTAPHEESLLTSIADSASDPQQPSKGENLEGYAPSEQETIRNTTEEAIEQEQSFTTAPASFGLSADPAILSMSPYQVPRDKGKGRELGNPSCSQGHTLPQRRRDIPPRLALADEGMKQLELALAEWTVHANKNKEELERIQSTISNSTRNARSTSEALRDICQMFE